IYYTADERERSIFPGEEPLYSTLKDYYPIWKQEEAERERGQRDLDRLEKVMAHMEAVKQQGAVPSPEQPSVVPEQEGLPATTRERGRTRLADALEDFATHGLANRARAA